MRSVLSEEARNPEPETPDYLPPVQVWGRVTRLENGSLLLCTDAQFQTMDPALRERFVLTDLPAFPLYFDAAGISTNDPSPYRIYVCANGGIDLTALEY